MENSRSGKRKLISIRGPHEEGQQQQGRLTKDGQKASMTIPADKAEMPAETVLKTFHSRGNKSGTTLGFGAGKSGTRSTDRGTAPPGRRRQSSMENSSNLDDHRDAAREVHGRGGKDRLDSALFSQDGLHSLHREESDDETVREQLTMLHTPKKKKRVCEAPRVGELPDKQASYKPGSKNAHDSPISRRTDQSKGKGPRQPPQEDSSDDTSDDEEGLSSAEKGTGHEVCVPKPDKLPSAC